MADHHTPQEGYSPEMDGPTHEATYSGFVKFTEIGALVVLCWVVSLAIGGIKAAWLTAIVGVLLAGAAGAIGGYAPSIGWRAPGAVLALLLVLLVLL